MPAGGEMSTGGEMPGLLVCGALIRQGTWGTWGFDANGVIGVLWVGISTHYVCQWGRGHLGLTWDFGANGVMGALWVRILHIICVPVGDLGLGT